MRDDTSQLTGPRYDANAVRECDCDNWYGKRPHRCECPPDTHVVAGRREPRHACQRAQALAEIAAADADEILSGQQLPTQPEQEKQ